MSCILTFLISDPEPQIMDYQAQQNKLFPPMAATFAFHFASDYIWNTYNEANNSMAQGDMDLLPDVGPFLWFIFWAKVKLIKFSLFKNSYTDFLVPWRRYAAVSRLILLKHCVNLAAVTVTWYIFDFFYSISRVPFKTCIPFRLAVISHVFTDMLPLLRPMKVKTLFFGFKLQGKHNFILYQMKLFFS